MTDHDSWLFKSSELSAQTLGMRTSRTWTNTVESEKRRNSRRSWWKRGTHLSLQVAQQHTRFMASVDSIIARPMHHAKQTQWCGPGPGVHECPRSLFYPKSFLIMEKVRSPNARERPATRNRYCMHRHGSGRGRSNHVTIRVCVCQFASSATRGLGAFGQLTRNN